MINIFPYNVLRRTDSYKASHYRAYPDGTQSVFSYIESRGGAWDRTVVFGLQMWLKTYGMTRITPEMAEVAKKRTEMHGEPFNTEGVKIIVNEYGGRLPLTIRAVPEGTILPVKNAMVTVENTDPRMGWLTSYVETSLLRAVWYPTTVATLSWHIKQVIKAALEKSGDPSLINFKLHDFGARGVSSGESGQIGGAAHLVNFMGTDTMEALDAVWEFYGEEMAGYSIPAAEHSTVTSWGEAGETAAYERMLDLFAKPGALVAVVSDSYDLMNAVTNIWGGTLRERIMNSGATVVIRPDSGDPVTMSVQTVEGLGAKFGFTVNAKGYKVLHPSVRVIYGDGINEQSVAAILNALMTAGWSADNIAFGMGGALLQQINRDTLKFAMKASAVSVNGVWRDVFKAPKTDPGKRSKAGRLALIREHGRWETVPLDGNHWRNELVEVYRDGEIKKEWTFAEIRERSNRPPLD